MSDRYNPDDIQSKQRQHAWNECGGTSRDKKREKDGESKKRAGMKGYKARGFVE